MVACPAGSGTLLEALARLDEIAPGVPLLALGQTVFWDEPMKALVAQAAPNRRFIAGVHDTDFFAKLPSGARQPGAFRTVPTTIRPPADSGAPRPSSPRCSAPKPSSPGTCFSWRAFPSDVWSPGSLAFSIARPKPGDGGASSRSMSRPPLTSEVPAIALMPELLATLGWAMDGALAVAPGQEHAASELKARVAEACATGSLADAYERLAPEMYAFAAGEPVSVETDRTSHLLRFNRETCGRPRFSLARLFIESSTRPTARASYDEALKGGRNWRGTVRALADSAPARFRSISSSPATGAASSDSARAAR